MKNILALGIIGIVGFLAYKQYQKKKGSCSCGCKTDTASKSPANPTTALPSTQVVPDAVSQVYDASPSAFFRPPARKPIVGSFVVQDSNGLAYGAGATENMDSQSAVNFVQQ
jgi:hypothetical protein